MTTRVISPYTRILLVSFASTSSLMSFPPSVAGTRLSFDDVFGASQDAANEALLGRVSLTWDSNLYLLLLATRAAHRNPFGCLDSRLICSLSLVGVLKVPSRRLMH
jgi:hypothetical protein